MRNPCPVVDRQTVTVYLLMTHNLGIDREPQIIDETSQGTRTVWAAQSADDGASWSKPRGITSATKRKDWTWYATGPGAGIQLKSGRLVIPCDHIEAGTKKYFSHVIYSDDGGGTWRLGGRTPADQVNECEVVELADGRLLLNMRNYDRARRARAVSMSRDGGLSWSPVTHDEALIEPVCQASIRRFSTAKTNRRNRILFSNPASKASASVDRAIVLRRVSDVGRRQDHQRGRPAYSCSRVPDKTLICPTSAAKRIRISASPLHASTRVADDGKTAKSKHENGTRMDRMGEEGNS